MKVLNSVYYNKKSTYIKEQLKYAQLQEQYQFQFENQQITKNME